MPFINQIDTICFRNSPARQMLFNYVQSIPQGCFNHIPFWVSIIIVNAQHLLWVHREAREVIDCFSNTNHPFRNLLTSLAANCLVEEVKRELVGDKISRVFYIISEAVTLAYAIHHFEHFTSTVIHPQATHVFSKTNMTSSTNMLGRNKFFIVANHSSWADHW
jgi:hypothetical protein